jgi:hypothetical protein
MKIFNLHTDGEKFSIKFIEEIKCALFNGDIYQIAVSVDVDMEIIHDRIYRPAIFQDYG